jgi:sporulation-control protein spo0M
MGFSEKMRDSLGAEGARLEVRAPGEPLEPGATATIVVVIIGGSKPAAVDALVVRMSESHRQWIDGAGNALSEADAQTQNQTQNQTQHDSANAELVPSWTKTMLSERRIAVGTTVEPGQQHEIEVELAIPGRCERSSPSCTHTVLVQADIKGQIDPSGQARITVGGPDSPPDAASS